MQAKEKWNKMETILADPAKYGMMLETKRICQFLDEGDAGWISIRF